MITIDPNPAQYSDQLAEKQQRFTALSAPFEPPPLEVYSSPPLHYRQRAGFRIWHEAAGSHYAVFEKGSGETPTFVAQFPPASTLINKCMPKLLASIEAGPLLRHKLFQVEFLSTLNRELLLTLVYHKPLNEDWIETTQQLQAELAVDIIGRSRKQKIVLERDFVTEIFHVSGRKFQYRQLEGCFSQPNGAVCEKMLNWTSSVAEGSRGALLELYCGNGNFTLPLSLHFDRVLATEISKPLIHTAEHNAEVNGINNIAFARMSAEEVAEAIAGVRPFRRLQHVNLSDYNFSTVFVDPPRAGLDEKTLAMVQGFDNIIYISCNPHTLVENLHVLNKTHVIERAALFDQFPYTDHMECGVYLRHK
ncbi:MAG: tRNA (uridine(54)-C5)-methyltransferase TrmA [Cellvibrionaceae bacterium]